MRDASGEGREPFSWVVTKLFQQRNLSSLGSAEIKCHGYQNQGSGRRENEAPIEVR